MIIQIQSENPWFLDLLYKNPSTDLGLYAKPLRNGIVIGNTVDAHNYEVIFQDTKYSYLPEDSNTIDFQSYCSPLTILNICTEFFSHSLKSRDEYKASMVSWLDKSQGELDTYSCLIIVPTFYVHSSWYKDGVFLLSKYFKGIEITHLVGRNFELKINAASVFDAINLLTLVSLFTHITNEYGLFTFIDDMFATKYVRVLTNLENVPYFVFYLYIRRAVKNERQFQIIKPICEAYLLKEGIEAQLSYLGTHHDRVKFISKELDLNTNIIDIGCGEFIYYKKMMNMKFSKSYFAIDKEAHFERLGIAISSRYEANNLIFYTSIDDCKTTETVNVILTEVIEHNTIEEARELVKKALKFNFNKIIITTPNISFNKFYSEDLKSRHDDHHFEFTEIEFVNFINDCVNENQNYQVTIDFIGDKLNSIQPTQVAIIQNK